MTEEGGRRSWATRGRRASKLDADAGVVDVDHGHVIYVPVSDSDVASYEDVIEESIDVDHTGPQGDDDIGCQNMESGSGAYTYRAGGSGSGGAVSGGGASKLTVSRAEELSTVMTEDGKTWRKRAHRKDGNFVTEYYSCVMCEAVCAKHPELASASNILSLKAAQLSFRYCLSTGERVLMTDLSTRLHFCEKAPTDGAEAEGDAPDDHLDALLKTVDEPGPSSSRKDSHHRRWHSADKHLLVHSASLTDDWVLREHEERKTKVVTSGIPNGSSSVVVVDRDDEEGEDGENKVDDNTDLSPAGPSPAATAHRRRLMKQKRLANMQREEREREEAKFVNGDENIFVVDGKPKKGSTPPEGFPFKTGLSSKGQEGTLIVITDDGKTWRRRNMRKKSRGAVVTEYFNCISCESLKKQFPDGKFPTLTFVYTPASDTRILLTDPDSRTHICGRSTARTTAEQLVRKRKAVAKLAGIRPIHAYESAACEAQDMGETEHWDNNFLSNVLEEIVTRTPKRPRSGLVQGPGTGNSASPSGYNAMGKCEREDSVPSGDREDAYPPEFPPDLAEQIKALVASARAPASAGSWQLYTGDGIIVFVRR